MSLRLHVALGALFLVSLAACFESNTVECSGGVVCPSGSVCTADGLGCVTSSGCGNGQPDTGEQCDDGNQIDEDDCKADCTFNVCGDSKLDLQGDVQEECDTAGADSATCDDDCTMVVCGDGHTNSDADEICDDGNTVDGDGTCKGDCSSDESCGNNVIDDHLPGAVGCNSAVTDGTNCPEVCDDGNHIAGDGCSPNCLSEETCRNGILDSSGGPGNPVEICDDGDIVDTNTCRNDCQGGAGCGNGLLDVASEQCDPGSVNTNVALCDRDCTIPICGDNIHNMPAGEACDPGALGVDVAGCNSNCTIPACGDGRVNRMFTPIGGSVPEQCDDGGTVAGDGCSATCQIETCGNGVTEMINGEACDDGDTDDLDGCRNNCQVPRCGDGIASTPPLEQCDTNGASQTCNLDCTPAACGDGKVNTMFTPVGGVAPESCDDGDTDSGDGCSSLCRIESCGNGLEEPLNGEECDDNNNVDTDACRNNCQDAVCGDNVTQTGVEDCDTGGDSTTCDYNCTDVECDDGVVNTVAGEQCEDGNTDNGDGCSSTCRLEPIALAVVKAGTGTGTVTTMAPDPGINCGTDCSELYFVNTMVTLLAAPSANSTFTGWSGTGVSCAGTGPCVVTMSSARSVTATFSANVLSVTKDGTGTGVVTSNVGGINCGGTCAATYNTGTMVTLTAAPTTATSNFTAWGGAGSTCGAALMCTVTVSQAATVTATFTLRTFTLTAAKNGTGSGTVSSGPAGIDCGPTCMAGFTAGTLVTLVATPASNSNFTGWAGTGTGFACPGTGNCTVTMDQARTVTATFTLKTFTLTVTKTGVGGNIAGTGINCGNGTDCTETVASGTSIVLTATPNAGNAFSGWSGASCSGTGTCTVIVDANVTVNADFDDNTLTVTRTGDGNGTVTSSPGGINCGGDCSEDFNVTTVVTLTAAANSTSRFTGWSGTGVTCVGTGPCMVTMNGPTTVIANFVDTQVLTVTNAGAGDGTVTSNPSGINCASAGPTCVFAFDEDTMVILSAAANPTSTFTGWTGPSTGGASCGTGSLGTCTLTLSQARNVTATFVPNFTLTVTPAGTGTGSVGSAPGGISCSPTCAFAFQDGTSVTLVATPSGGSTFAGWTGTGTAATGTCITGSTGNCVLSMTAARAVTATFNPPPQFALTVTVVGTGTVSSAPAGIAACAAAAGDCMESYTSGTMVTLTASASTMSWAGCATMTATTCNVTMDMVRNVTATFP